MRRDVEGVARWALGVSEVPSSTWVVGQETRRAPTYAMTMLRPSSLCSRKANQKEVCQHAISSLSASIVLDTHAIGLLQFLQLILHGTLCSL